MSDTNHLRKITIQELLDNNGENGKPLWCMIHNKIYDLTNFKHPGGRDVLENDEIDDYVDKGREFDSVGHPPAVDQQMKQFLIGELDKNSKIEKKSNKNNTQTAQSSSSAPNSSSGYGFAVIFFVLAAIALGVAFVLSKQ
jgi:cytochrome b involved in lipid metabolism